MIAGLQVLVITVKNAALGPVMVTAPVVSEPCDKLVKVAVLLVVELVASMPKSIVVEETVSGVMLFCTASLALSIPAPQLLLVAQSLAGNSNPVDV